MNRKWLVSCLIAGALCTPPVAQAVLIPVIDDANITQQNLTYLEAAKNVINTAKQIELQVLELKSLPNNVLSQYRNTLNNDLNQIKGVLKEAKGVLDPTKDVVKAWEETFESAGEITKDNVTMDLLVASNSNTIYALDQSNFDSMKIIKASMTEIENTQKRLQKLMELNASAEGQKQAAQIQNMILAEQTKIMLLQNNIRAAEAAARITNYQRTNQIDAQAQAVGQKAAESLENYPNPIFKL